MKKKIEIKDQLVEIGIGDELWFNAHDLAKFSHLTLTSYLLLPRTERLIAKSGKCALTVDNTVWFRKDIALDFAKWQGSEQYAMVREAVLAEKPFIPKIIDHENMVAVDSIDVADAFEKDHKHVLEAIRKSDCSEDFRRSNYRPSEYIDNDGITQPCMMMTRDGFSFLVMGFTGKAAARFKEIYIKAFNDMEQKLRNQVVALPKDYPSALRALADAEEARMIAEASAKENQEKAEIVNLIVEKADNYTMQQAANVLGTGRTRFFKWLRENGYFQENNEPYQKYIGQHAYFTVKEIPKDGKIYHTPLVTPLGLTHFAKKIEKLENIRNKKSKSLVLFNPN